MELVACPHVASGGTIAPGNYCSGFSHEKESAHPGYYQVYLERYKVNAELTSTLRCAYHKYTFGKGDDKSLLVDIRRSNNDVRDWKIEKVDDNTFTGYQDGDGKIYFYAKTNYKIGQVEMVKTTNMRWLCCVLSTAKVLNLWK